jgi:hypothetical protein
MNRIVLLMCVIFGLAMSFFSPPEGAIAAMLTFVVSVPALILIRKYTEEKEFLTNIFLIALLARLGLGISVLYFGGTDFFAGDVYTYDAVGQRLVEIWQGLPVPNDQITYRAGLTAGPAWGMYYLIGAIYFVCGQSILVGQSFCAVIGAATAPMIYFCAEKIFQNQRVAKLSAIAIALFPSFVLWSSQMLKDGLIIFLLVLVMTMILQLQVKFSYGSIAALIFSLFGILSLRFYIFYIIVLAVVGSFTIGVNTSGKSIVRRVLVIFILGLSLVYLGVLKNAGEEFETYGSLEKIQQGRNYLRDAGDSGFGEEIDVSTTGGAIAALPVGMSYLMLAPFPWQISNTRQAITLPEVMIWWALIPLMFSGLWYTIKHRLRNAIPVLIFALMLTIAYSIFQGNVGTAYRQRTQIQVFLFMFIAVGWTLILEKRENKRALQLAKNRNFEEKLRENIHSLED